MIKTALRGEQTGKTGISVQCKPVNLQRQVSRFWEPALFFAQINEISCKFIICLYSVYTFLMLTSCQNRHFEGEKMAYLSQKLPIKLRTIFMVYHMVYHDFLYVLLISNKEVHYI